MIGITAIGQVAHHVCYILVQVMPMIAFLRDKRARERERAERESREQREREQREREQRERAER